MTGCRGRIADKDIIAKVGDDILTRKNMQEQMVWEGMQPNQESEFIQRWVDRELLYREAKRLGLNKSTDLQLELELVEKEFLINKLLERTFLERVQITEEDINSYYEKNKDLFQVDQDEVRVLQILTKTQTEANVVLQEIRLGKSFEEAAKEHSIDIFRNRGGDMGFIRKEDTIPEVTRVAFHLSENAISPVFQTAQGYHIVKMIKRRAKGETKEVGEVHDIIAQRLRINKERSVYRDLLFQMQNKSKFYIANPQIQGLVQDSTNMKE
jgi:peptidyl-prolyl cis-trans isomerase C